jgi:hypothetical protein
MLLYTASSVLATEQLGNGPMVVMFGILILTTVAALFGTFKTSQ